MVSVIGEILNAFASAKQPGVYQAVVKAALPTLCNAVGMPKPDESSWVPSSAIDLITNIQTAAPAEGLGEGFFSTLAPSLFVCLATAEDRDILQVNLISIDFFESNYLFCSNRTASSFSQVSSERMSTNSYCGTMLKAKVASTTS